MCTANKAAQRAPVKSHASQGHVERSVRLAEKQYRAVLFDVQDRTRVEVDPTSAAPAWILRHSDRFSIGTNDIKGGATSFERLSGTPHRSPILPLFAMVSSVWCYWTENLEEFSWLRKGAPRTLRSMRVGRAEESDENLMVNEIGRVVRARAVRPCVENENSCPDVCKLTSTPSYLKLDGDVVEMQSV